MIPPTPGHPRSRWDTSVPGFNPGRAGGPVWLEHQTRETDKSSARPSAVRPLCRSALLSNLSYLYHVIIAKNSRNRIDHTLRPLALPFVLAADCGHVRATRSQDIGLSDAHCPPERNGRALTPVRVLLNWPLFFFTFSKSSLQAAALWPPHRGWRVVVVIIC